MRHVFLAFVLAAFCMPAVAAGEMRGDAARGSELAHQWCSACHLLPGMTRAGDAAPPFRELAKRPDFDANKMRILLGRPHSSMPPLTLSRQEVNDLAAYIASLKDQ